MKDGQWYTISGWMGKYLGLRANDLICFAVIYGFSMDGESQFKGNLEYLCKCMFTSKPTALLCLKHLLKCNLILKQEDVINGKKRCYYATNIIFENGKFDIIDTGKEPLMMTTKEPLPVIGKEPLPKEYNNNNNKENDISDDISKSEEYPEDFLEFWKAYGYSKDKGTTYKRWKKLSVKDKKAALEALPLYFDDCKRHDRSKQYPATYLNKRTWEDGFDKNENEESPVSVNEIPAADVKPWESVQQWLKDKTPGYADLVTYKDFTEMRGYAMFNAKKFADILIKMYESGYEGDIVSEFKRLFDEV